MLIIWLARTELANDDLDDNYTSIPYGTLTIKIYGKILVDDTLETLSKWEVSLSAFCREFLEVFKPGCCMCYSGYRPFSILQSASIMIGYQKFLLLRILHKCQLILSCMKLSEVHHHHARTVYRVLASLSALVILSMNFFHGPL